jgi:hypothetical protein
MGERQFIAELERSSYHTHVLLITTGSVASIKAPLIVQELLKVSAAGSYARYHHVIHHNHTPITAYLVQQRQSRSSFDKRVPCVLQGRRR